MKIPQDLVQFDNRKALIIVSGAQEARFLLAHDGQLEELHDFKVEKITYSDREGHFLRRAFGRVLGSGSVYENKKERQTIEFLSEFKKHFKKVLTTLKPKEIIICAPDYIEPKITEVASKKHEVKQVLHGNYTNDKLVDILKIITNKEKEASPTAPASEEVQKILNKGMDN